MGLRHGLLVHLLLLLLRDKHRVGPCWDRRSTKSRAARMVKLLLHHWNVLHRHLRVRGLELLQERPRLRHLHAGLLKCGGVGSLLGDEPGLRGKVREAGLLPLLLVGVQLLRQDHRGHGRCAEIWKRDLSYLLLRLGKLRCCGCRPQVLWELSLRCPELRL